MRLYRSKPAEVEAVQWTGKNPTEVKTFNPKGISFPHDYVGCVRLLAGKDGAQGWVNVPPGHWIVRNPGDDSDYWPVDASYFAAKYEPAEWGDDPKLGLPLRPCD